MYDFAAGKAAWLAGGLPIEGADASVPRAGDHARADVPTCRLSESLQSVRERARAAGWDTCIVVNEERIVLGRLGRSALTSDDDAAVEQAMSEGPSTIRPDTTLETITQRLRGQSLVTALVTTLDVGSSDWSGSTTRRGRTGGAETGSTVLNQAEVDRLRPDHIP